MDFFFTQTLSGTFPEMFLKSRGERNQGIEVGEGDFGERSDLFLTIFIFAYEFQILST